MSVQQERKRCALRKLSHTMVVALLLCVLRVSAVAQPRPDSRSMAQSLFDEARRLMDAGEFAQACAKLEESQAIDPGVGTQLNIAHCYEQVGRSASAWAAYVDAESAARAACQFERADYAHERALALAATVPKLTLRLAPSIKSLAKLEITLNGRSVGSSLLGTAIALDPGEYAVLARAPGYEDWSTTLQLRSGVDSGVLIPELRRVAPVSSARRQAPLPAIPRAPVQAPTAATRRSVSLALGGAGLVGVTVGSALALDAKGRYDRAVDASCAAGNCSRWAISQADAARRQGNWATATSVVGGALLAGGIVLWLTTPHASSAHGTLHPQLRSLQMSMDGIALSGAL